MTPVELPREELERMIFFEEACQRAESDHDKDPTDAQVLTRWGGALLELAHFRNGSDAVEMIERAVKKFDAALKINPRKHDALWCLGNALTSQGFLFREQSKAEEYFNKAKSCFQRALNEEPTNEIYKKALEMTDKAPGLHAELQRQLAEQELEQNKVRRPQSSAGSTTEASVSSEWFYDISGWVCFAGIALSWAMLQREQN